MKLSENPEILLEQVGKAHSNKMNQILEKINMHKGQPMMLFLLCKEDGISQATLAKELMIKPATVSMMVKRMEKAGLVTRKRDAEDERISNVYVTDEGREIGSQLKSFQKEMEEVVFDGFSEVEKADIKNYLERILKNLK